MPSIGSGPRILQHFAVLITFGGLVSACKPEAPGPEETASTSQPATHPQPSQPASEPAAPQAAAGNPCFEAFSTEGETKTYTVGGVTFKQTGTVLTMASDEGKSTRLGVLGNIKEFSEENDRAVKAYLEFFASKKVDAIVVTGDVGESVSDIHKALAAIFEAGVPVFAIVGNRESGSDFDKALSTLREEGKVVFNLNYLRLVKLDDHALVSVPGYYNADYVYPSDGCVYGSKELGEVKKALMAAKDLPVILVSHGPPRQTGPEGIDIVSEGDHVGDPALQKLAREGKVPFSLSSNIQESGGKASNRDGSKEVKAGVASEELFFNPGGADRTVAWKMNTGEFAYGMAGVVTYEGNKASFDLMRLPEPE